MIFDSPILSTHKNLMEQSNVENHMKSDIMELDKVTTDSIVIGNGDKSKINSPMFESNISSIKGKIIIKTI